MRDILALGACGDTIVNGQRWYDCYLPHLFDPRALGATGRTVRCTHCNHVWMQLPAEDAPRRVDLPLPGLDRPLPPRPAPQARPLPPPPVIPPPPSFAAAAPAAVLEDEP